MKAALPAPPRPNPFAATVDWKSDELSTPAGLWLRLKSPTSVVPRVLNLAADPTLRGFSDPNTWASIALGAELSSLIDLDGPIDVFVPRGPDPLSALGVAHLKDEARFAPENIASQLKFISRGRWEIGHLDAVSTRCELWHVVPPVGYRILCGQDAAVIAQFAPFLLGHLAKRALRADARIESSGYPLHEATSRETSRSPAARGSDDATDVVDATPPWLTALANAESIALDLNLHEQDIELKLALDYATADTSVAFQHWIDSAARPLPAQFWQALDLAPITIASSGTDERTMEELLHDSCSPFFQALCELNASSGSTPEFFERMRDATGEFIPAGLRFTLSAASSLSPSGREKKRSRQPISPQANGVAGGTWFLTGFAGPGPRYVAGLGVLFDAGRAKHRGAPGTDVPAPIRYLPINKHPPELPKESLLFSVNSSDHISFGWVLPTADWVWVLTANTESQLLKQARRLLTSLQNSSAPDAAAQAAFAGEPPRVAVSFTLASLIATFLEGRSDMDVSALPFGGSTRVYAQLTGRREQRNEHPVLSLELSSHWSPAAAADLAAFVNANAKDQ